jgi:hypothetical protein
VQVMQAYNRESRNCIKGAHGVVDNDKGDEILLLSRDSNFTMIKLTP